MFCFPFLSEHKIRMPEIMIGGAEEGDYADRQTRRSEKFLA